MGPYKVYQHDEYQQMAPYKDNLVNIPLKFAGKVFYDEFVDHVTADIPADGRSDPVHATDRLDDRHIQRVTTKTKHQHVAAHSTTDQLTNKYCLQILDFTLNSFMLQNNLTVYLIKTVFTKHQLIHYDG